MKIGHVDLKQLRFLTDKSIGLNKEILGTFIGREELQAEGRAQQERGTKELEALKAEATADVKRAEVKAQERRQRGAQATKEAASN